MADFKIGAGKVGQDKVGIAGAFLTDGEGDSWWGGAQSCFAGVAIAGIAAALSITTAIAGGFTHNAKTDEVLPVAAPSVGYGQTVIPTQRARNETRFVGFGSVDELPLVAVPLVDESGPALWSPSAPPPVTASWTDNEQLPSAVSDLDPWQPLWASLVPVAPSVVPAAQPWASLDELPALSLNDAYTWDAPTKLTSIATPVVWADGDEVVPAAGPIEGGGAGPTDTGMRARFGTSFVRLFQSDELPAGAALSLEDDYQWQDWAGICAPIQALAPFHQDETFSALSEEYWSRFDLVQPAALSSAYFWHQDELAVSVASIVDIEQAAIDYRAAEKPIAVVWNDNEYFVQAAVFPPDEQGWNFDQRNLDSATYTIWAENEDIVPQGAAPIQGGGAGLTDTGQRVVSGTRFVRQFAQDELPGVVPFVPDEDLAPDLPAVPGQITYTIWAENDDVVPVAGFVAQDDYWQAPFSVKVDPLVTVWRVEDDTFMPVPPLEIEEYTWDVYTPLAPAARPMYAPDLDADDYPAGFLVAPPDTNKPEWLVVSRRRLKR